MSTLHSSIASRINSASATDSVEQRGIHILVISRRSMARSDQYAVLRSLTNVCSLIEVATSADAIALMRARPFDIVLLVVTGATQTALETLREVKLCAPQTPLLAINAAHDQQNAVLLLRNGANGYVGSDAMTTELGNAIESVLRGHRYIS